MGEAGVQRQERAVFRPLVAFDFDGTLTSRDSFIEFLTWRHGRAAFVAGLARLGFSGLNYLLHRDRGRLKARFIKEFLGGVTRTELETEAQAFAGQRGRALLRPDAFRAWQRWQAEGARLIICTASPDIIVGPIARGLGADVLIGTRLVFDAAGKVTGALDGANCRGPEKVRRLREMFGDDVHLEAAYGDSDGDTQMLALAEEQGMKVFNGR